MLLRPELWVRCCHLWGFVLPFLRDCGEGLMGRKEVSAGC